MSQNIINCLYEHFKNTPKKLKIVCDWDEVIQSHEPFALYLATKEKSGLFSSSFEKSFKEFWKATNVDYSPYGSQLKEKFFDKQIIEKQQAIKNSPDSYQNQPFLTIAQELLKLIKENKVERLIFLSAYDKRKFPKGDERKKIIVRETFGKHPFCSLELIGYDSEEKGATKADWIKVNAADFDIMIDDNPYICQSIAENIPNIKVITPHYPAIANKHHKKVLLIKTNISELNKESF